MPKRRLRKLLLDRLSKEVRAAGELGLAFLMTAGVVSCGGIASRGPGGGGDGGDGGGGDDGAVNESGDMDHGQQVEVANCDDARCGVEAAQEAAVRDAGREIGPIVEAAFFEGGTKD